ncbi:MAG: PPE family protein [Mycobacterium sp.]|nr:PPE family protein [Mycobacterium sp.]
MDYGTFPPEVNSTRMYSGPGAESLLAAAAAWSGLAAELRATAASYSSVVSGLAGAWLGASSAQMVAAAAPYAAWLTGTAAQAEETANQARAAAAAYETAFAATVPPSTVAANRAQLGSLVATNVFGQNTAAIAQNEAQYAGMWARDAAAMYGYAAQSATAAALHPFRPPAQNTDPAGMANQAAAVAHSIGTPGVSSAQSALAQLTALTPAALQSLAAPATATPAQAGPLSSLTGLLSGLDSSPLATIASNGEAVVKTLLFANVALINTILGLVAGQRHLSNLVIIAEGAAGSTLSAGLGSGAASAASAVSASVGQAGLIGKLAVPPSWAAATPAIRTVAAVLSSTSAGAVPAAAVSQGALFAGMGLAGTVGGAAGAALPRAVAGAGGKCRGAASKDGDRMKLKDGDSPAQLQRIVAEMAKKPDSVQHWHTDPGHLDGLLAELRKKPGIHAVHVKGGKTRAESPKPWRS